MNFNQWKISTRLVILIGFLSAQLISIGALGLYGNAKSNDALRSVYGDRVVALGQLSEISYLVQRNRVLVMDMLLQPEALNVAKRNRELRANVEKIAKTDAGFLATERTPEEAKLADDFGRVRNSYEQEGLLPLADAMLSARMEAARAILVSQ